MAETIKIFELNIDVDAAIKSTSKLKTDSDNLKKTLNDLKKSGDTSSETYVRLAAAYKNVNKQYNSSQVQIGKLIELQGKEIKTIEQGRNALTIINKEWAKQTELYGENSAEVQKLSQKKLELTERLKALEKATGDNTRNVGNYKDGVKGAFGEIENLSGGLGGAISKMKGLTKTSLAFLATPLGAFLAILVGAFALVKSAMNRSEDSTNKIRKAFSGFQGITNALMKVLEPLGKFLIDGLVKGFELAEKAIYKGIDTIASGLELLGFDNQAASLRAFNAEVQQGAKDAKILADAEAELTKAQRTAQKTQLDYQKQAEKLRQIRDDESKSIAQRVLANEELGKTLQKQLESELAIAEQALKVAELRIIADGETKDTLDGQAEALEKIAEIQERITSQESEQLTNRNQLYREGAQQAKEAADKAIQAQQESLDKYIEQEGIRKKTLQERLAFEQSVAKKSIEILDAELKNKNISQEKYDTEYLKIQNGLAQTRADLVIENAKLELDNFIRNNKSKIDNEKLFSDELLQVEQNRLDAIAEKQRQFAQTQLEQGVINRTEYNAAIQAIDDENEANKVSIEQANLEAKKERDLLLKEQKAEAEAIDLDNRRLLEQENLEFDLQTQLDYLQRKKQQELEEAESKGADLQLIQDKYAVAEIAIKEKVRQAKLDIASSFLNNISSILGQESDLGKSVAIGAVIAEKAKSVSQIVANTGIANAKAVAASPLTAGQPWVAINTISGGASIASSVAAGAKAIGEITKAEKGGLFEIGGKRHSQGGTKFYGEDGTAFEAEQGELIGVMNRNAAAIFMDFNNRNLSSNVGNNYFADGGIVQRSLQGGLASQQTSVRVNPIDYAKLSETLTESIKELPPPVTDVEDIIGAVSTRNEVVSGANI